jgi:hypothetical protein
MAPSTKKKGPATSANSTAVAPFSERRNLESFLSSQVLRSVFIDASRP